MSGKIIFKQLSKDLRQKNMALNFWLKQCNCTNLKQVALFSIPSFDIYSLICLKFSLRSIRHRGRKCHLQFIKKLILYETYKVTEY